MGSAAGEQPQPGWGSWEGGASSPCWGTADTPGPAPHPRGRNLTISLAFPQSEPTPWQDQGSRFPPAQHPAGTRIGTRVAVPREEKASGPEDRQNHHCRDQGFIYTSRKTLTQSHVRRKKQTNPKDQAICLLNANACTPQRTWPPHRAAECLLSSFSARRNRRHDIFLVICATENTI